MFQDKRTPLPEFATISVRFKVQLSTLQADDQQQKDAVLQNLETSET